MTSHDDVQAWATAASVERLGQLTAEWLRGHRNWSPWQETPDPETTPLIEALAHANDRGFVTDFSQPAEPNHDGNGQRACVSGWCTHQTARRLQLLHNTTDLIVMPYPPHAPDELMLPVSLENGTGYTFLGARPDSDAETNPVVVGPDHQPLTVPNLVLSQSWYCCVIDPAWGRPAPLLWDELTRVLSTVEPVDLPEVYPFIDMSKYG